MIIRRPAVSGMFYPGNSKALREMIAQCFLHVLGPGKLSPRLEVTEKVYGVISPHAGYQYSGPIACQSVYQFSTQHPDLFIVVGPNHQGVGSAVASIMHGLWETPLGIIQIDEEAAKELNHMMPTVVFDSTAHKKEHSVEVQMPILQEAFAHFKILPILLNDQSQSVSVALGKAISQVATKRKSIIIGSSDFTHYEPQAIALKKDSVLIEAILTLDVDLFYQVLHFHKVSACGYGAIASTMEACKVLGATQGKLIEYATSGEVTHDEKSVVGYASIIFV